MNKIYEDIALTYWDNPYDNLAKLFGVKMNSFFEIDGFGSFFYKLTDSGLLAYDKHLHTELVSYTLESLIKGKCKVKKERK